MGTSLGISYQVLMSGILILSQERSLMSQFWNYVKWYKFAHFLAQWQSFGVKISNYDSGMTMEAENMHIKSLSSIIQNHFSEMPHFGIIKKHVPNKQMNKQIAKNKTNQSITTDTKVRA